MIFPFGLHLFLIWLLWWNQFGIPLILKLIFCHILYPFLHESRQLMVDILDTSSIRVFYLFIYIWCLYAVSYFLFFIFYYATCLLSVTINWVMSRVPLLSIEAHNTWHFNRSKSGRSSLEFCSLHTLSHSHAHTHSRTHTHTHTLSNKEEGTGGLYTYFGCLPRLLSLSPLPPTALPQRVISSLLPLFPHISLVIIFPQYAPCQGCS